MELTKEEAQAIYEVFFNMQIPTALDNAVEMMAKAKSIQAKMQAHIATFDTEDEPKENG